MRAHFLSLFLLCSSTIALAQPASQPALLSTTPPEDSMTKPSLKSTPFAPKEILERVRENYPEIPVIKAEAKAAELRVPQAGALDDPRVSVMPNFINPAVKGQGEVELWVKQSLPGPGKRALRQKVAEKEAQATTLAISESQRYAEQLAWESLAKVIALDTEAEILIHHLSFADVVIEAATLSYATRKAPLSGTLEAKMVRAELEIRQLQIKGERAGEVAALNYLMGLPAGTPLETAPSLSPAPVDEPLEQLISRALSKRPTLKAEALRLEGANANIDLAQKERRPDYDVGVALQPQFDGTVQFGGFVEVMVPLYAKNKQDKAIEEAKAMAEAQRARITLEEAKVAKEVAQAYVSFQSAQKQIELLQNTLAPNAKATYESSLLTYQVNQSPLSDVLQAQINLFHLEVMLQAMRSEALVARATLEAAVGGEVH